jgi:hypothetical protein
MSWATKYVGKEFASCIHLVQYVTAREFGIEKDLPDIENHAALMERRREWAQRVPPGVPLRDGLVVLMRPDSPLLHAGLLCLDTPEPTLLHTAHKPGSAVLQPMRIVRRVMKIEGIYEVLA